MSRTATTTWREASFWARLLTRLLRRHPGHVVVALALCWMVGLPLLWILTPAAVTLVGLRAWYVSSPRSFALFNAPFLGVVHAHRIRKLWVEVCSACDLRCGDERLVIQRSWPRLEVRAKPALGQTFEHFEHAAEALRSGFGALQIRVEPEGSSAVRLALTFDDWLGLPFDASPGHASAGLQHIVMGRRSDGATWRLPVGPHTLIAGSSGAGKGSVFWSYAFGLAPGVRDGRVQLHGVDLKGGMEILMGADLFTTVATTPAEAVGLLEQLVGSMRTRTTRYAGRVRSHVASDRGAAPCGDDR